MTVDLVSLVTTVKNEEASIDAFFDSVFAQSRLPDEVIVVDGGSTDATVERIRVRAAVEPRLVLLEAPRTNIAQGRNIAIDHARFPLIAVADAGTVLRPDWLARLIRPLAEDESLAVSSGFFEPGGTTWLERAISVVITPHAAEIDPDTFLPSSRSVAFRKHWWDRVGGYPEWLRHCEDLVFDFALRGAGAQFQFVPEARVTWRARRSLGGFFRQYYDYARGDGHAKLWPRRHLIRYGAYALGVELAAAVRHSPRARAALTAGVLWHLHRNLLRVWRATCFPSTSERVAAMAIAPLIVVTGDAAKMLGYPRGVLERARAGSPERIPDLIGDRG